MECHVRNRMSNVKGSSESVSRDHLESVPSVECHVRIGMSNMKGFSAAQPEDRLACLSGVNI